MGERGEGKSEGIDREGGGGQDGWKRMKSE